MFWELKIKLQKVTAIPAFLELPCGMASVGGTERSHVMRSTHGKSWSRNKGSDVFERGCA